MKSRMLWMVLAGLSLAPRDAAAQLDPLLFLKNRQPNIVVMVETNGRMQRDAENNFRDPNIYRRLGIVDAPWETALGVSDSNTSSAGTGTYRRKYVGLSLNSPGSDDKFNTDHIESVGNLDPAYSTFDERTRIAIARRGLAEAINRNVSVARFGLMRTRQNNPAFVTPASPGATLWNINSGPVKVTSGDSAWASQKLVGDTGVNKWAITRAVVTGNNGAVAGPVGPLVAADAAGANASALNILGLSTGVASSLIPAGNDDGNTDDHPLDLMLTDAKTEAARL